ncbi:hypothetical protein ACSYAD_09690 [Acaryochloris marina NIES-2412]|uniref:hypothetical protein n=1 Tax=Acaryochloris marina TaxID=155978 RepID=UPI004057D0C1
MQTTQKYKPNQSDLDTSFEGMGGKVHLTVFMDQAEKIKTENIDYRPACYWTGLSDCSGLITFEKTNQDKGTELIQAI